MSISANFELSKQAHRGSLQFGIHRPVASTRYLVLSSRIDVVQTCESWNNVERDGITPCRAVA